METAGMVRIPTHGAPTCPGEILLEEFLKTLGMTQTELAECIGVPINRVNEIIKRKRGSTVETALRLERLFGMDAQFRLNPRLAWELYHAQRASTAQEIKKIQRLKTA